MNSTPGQTQTQTQAQTPLTLGVLGGTGATGVFLVQYALDAGHRVTMLVRDPRRVVTPPHPNLTVVQGDVTMDDAVRSVVAGADVVISTLGTRINAPGVTVVQDGVAAVLRHLAPTARFVVVTSSSCHKPIAAKIPFLIRWLVHEILKSTYDDLEYAQELLEASSARWTVVCPPQIAPAPVEVGYTMAVSPAHAPGRGCTTFQDVARSVLRCAEAKDGVDPEFGSLDGKYVDMDSTAVVPSNERWTQLWDSFKQAVKYRALGHESPFAPKKNN
ncbi:hypothetical protein H9P43_000119 [Blastocladiella emersonii ATCC 22665]|nr:hypothetical protein H9P43_000119 [Blastocladiella emersonii ATCC 22665]